MREKFYDYCHYTVVGSIVLITTMGFGGICFLLYQAGQQKGRVTSAQDNGRQLKMAMRGNPLSRMSVSELRTHFKPYDHGLNKDGERISLLEVLKDPFLGQLKERGCPMEELLSWQKTDSISLEALCYTLAIVGRFVDRELLPDNPKNRKELGEFVYQMMGEYQGGMPVANNVKNYIHTCFNLGFLSDPNLGGQSVEEFMPNFVQFMLGDEEITMDSPVEKSMFRLFNRVPVYHLGLTQEKRKKKGYDSMPPSHGRDKPGRPGYVPHPGEETTK